MSVQGGNVKTKVIWQSVMWLVLFQVCVSLATWDITILQVYCSTAFRGAWLALWCERSPPTPRGGTPACKWRGWSKDFFGFVIFDSRIFLGWKIWQEFFWVTWFKQVIFWVLKTNLNALARPWRIYGMMNKQTREFNFLWFSLCYIIAQFRGNLTKDFLGGYFWSRDFFG